MRGKVQPRECREDMRRWNLWARELGHGSIVADLRRPEMKHILNARIKHRESFCPFAPSILREAAPEWFETDDDVPFMMQVCQNMSQSAR